MLAWPSADTPKEEYGPASFKQILFTFILVQQK
jgi:hypothetical protein